jgi:hypothetical protein
MPYTVIKSIPYNKVTRWFGLATSANSNGSANDKVQKLRGRLSQAKCSQPQIEEFLDNARAKAADLTSFINRCHQQVLNGAVGLNTASELLMSNNEFANDVGKAVTTIVVAPQIQTMKAFYTVEVRRNGNSLEAWFIEQAQETLWISASARNPAPAAIGWD